MRSRTASWGVALGLALLLTGCSGRKQVPFGLQEAGVPSGGGGLPGTAGAGGAPTPIGEVFETGRVEVQVGELAMVVPTGYALSALRTDLDGDSNVDALVVSSEARRVQLYAGFQRGMGVRAEQVDAFVVPDDCAEAKAAISQLSQDLALVRVDHLCGDGPRQNLWIVSLDTPPRARERITILPPNPRSKAPIGVTLRNEDRDSDGYDDVVAEVSVGEAQIPLVWLNRPGGFARDASEPEATFEQLAEGALAALQRQTTIAGAEATHALDAYTALCRESGAARVGLSGTHGLQCGSLQSVSKAASIAIASAVARGELLEALRLSDWWEQQPIESTERDRERVQAAWRTAKSPARSFRLIAKEPRQVPLRFEGEESLLVGGPSPRRISITDGRSTYLRQGTTAQTIRAPSGRFEVREVRRSCRGFEAVIGVIGAKRTFRVPIERASTPERCKAVLDRPTSALEWRVLGWAPQGLVVAMNERVRVVPLRTNARPAGPPFDLPSGMALPAPLLGPSVTPDGSRYLIPQSSGILVRSRGGGDDAVWLRPEGWDAVTGDVRAVAISPGGRQVAVHKGNEIRLLRW